ncbi:MULTISPECIES: asparagine synthase (glutamine-hydrolyzing) [unclassified Tolypothrix]|uniref:asparagine synthase (glutamine-hydrolyzing) n=1 Tax=unclassified Tolypothrix TaxID=2649714 RepID=UPI0005EAC64E|nr:MULTISPECIES: asparagine synthase (glutamine-hydrolyzing) [unclassified Tolypothrix]BAY92044.1 asparagine synthase (glutamine-hydrolysing) [Microchaete diplosiphon NIES-3275]EKF04760.1 asparagine synthase [Tolypothrix sp. PCC 7601]MBE9081751.1 asparagine synthase (glutamine-hydrolyzing) [Tolypothrix sp. LEGE 11397]UYD26032.1 asparagine synthase (glutamine-hydrolyzing) [Tolypothrix sp. PCC 7712]UYD31729.1 asparagine synthase (glutamine-hydrolyzing) [Tolypothrix sp. PCC 7601]
MCGIGGILTTNQYHNSLEKIIQRIQTHLKHRGPDDNGIYVSNDRQAAFAHTRLAILDLSPAGHQPMSTADQRYWITFNGEIYNFQELRQNLIAQGEQFHSQTDTEVILKLYQRMGSDCVQHLRGMFAFAIWDDWEKTCFLARDPLGIKPLYYWRSGSTLVFASELRAVLASGLPTVQMSIQGLYGYLVSGSVPEPYTLIEDVHCLDAGNWLYWQGQKITKKQYWQINFTPQIISATDAQEIVRAALVDSIQHHFISDVPVGIFLSGGIDSTTVLALATQTQDQQLSTYSIAFEEGQWNEGGISQEVAKFFGAKHTEYKITASSAKTLLPNFLAAIDQPSVDGFNTFCISKIAHENGMKVVLSGLGGDEVFGGYHSFQKIPRMVNWGKQIRLLPLVGASIGMSLANWGSSPKMKRLGDFLEQEPTLSDAYRTFRGIFSNKEACAIIQQYVGDKIFVKDSPSTISFPAKVSTPEDEVSLLELSCYMRNQLLRDSDVMSMRWGLELRVPLVDTALLEAVAPIPSNIRLAYGKQLLVQAVPELPDWVTKRRKQGFSFPFEQWMLGEFGEYFANLNILKNIPLEPWYRRWSLVILKLWWEKFQHEVN